MFSKMFSSISNSVEGAVIGIIVAVILILILQNTAFKGKNMTIMYFILVIVFAVCGGVIQNKYLSVDAETLPTPKEIVVDLNKNLKEGWQNTNGGFTFEQIKIAQNDSECPTYNDQIISLKCYDFNSYIVFSYDNNGSYQNILFYKSSDGLIIDGMINTYCTLDLMWHQWSYNLDTFKWVQDLTKWPEHKTTTQVVSVVPPIINGRHDNLVSLSRQEKRYLKWLYALKTNSNDMEVLLTNNATKLLSQVATSYFIKFGDVELIGTASTAMVKINSFYNYLYEQIKGEAYDTFKIIDATNCLCLPIAQVDQSKYPISASKQSEYDGAKYYGVYKCNIAVNLNFVKGNELLTSTQKNEDYVNDVRNNKDTKDIVIVEDIKPNYSFSKVVLKFNDTKNSDISKVDLLKNPVNIIFTNSSDNTVHTVTIDSKEKLKNGVDVLLSNNSTWKYQIDSSSLIFEDYQGSITIKNKSYSLFFDYYYLDNYTLVSVGLNAIGTIDTTKIDLVTNPVKIILTNDTKTYQFVFDSNAKLNSYESKVIELGEYNFTILSKQLVFTKVSGKLTITTTDRVMLFNYGMSIAEKLTFDVTINNTNYSANNFKLYSAVSNVNIIRETLSSSKTYLVTCYIYDEDGKLMETFKHTHSSTGACSDSWTSSSLVAGETYTLQLRFVDSSDSTVTYLSSIATFVYNGSTGYQVEYNVTKN